MLGTAILRAVYCILQVNPGSNGSDYMGANSLGWLFVGIMGCLVTTFMGIVCVCIVARPRSLSPANRWALGLNSVAFVILAAFVLWPH